MEIKPKPPTAKGPAEWFTGDVWMDSLVQPHDDSVVNVAAVHFHPGARTAWHSHGVDGALRQRWRVWARRAHGGGRRRPPGARSPLVQLT